MVAWRLALAFVVLASVLGAPSRADADPPRLRAAPPAPRLPAPFVLPDLTHPRFDGGLDWFVGRLATEDSRSTAAAIARLSMEATVLARRQVFIGFTYPFAVALPPDGGLAPFEAALPSGRRALAGNVEAHVRAVFPLPTWLEIGFVLAVVAPTATFDRTLRANTSAAHAAASFDPTNSVHFLPDRVTLRTAGDLRVVRGPFVLQGRHGLDIVIDDIGIENARVAGRLLGHVGYLVRDDLEVSLEGSQNYFFASVDEGSGPAAPAAAFAERYRITDARRAAVTIGPAIRFSTRDLDVGAALVTNLGNPLSPAADGFVALRVSVTAHVGSPSSP